MKDQIIKAITNSILLKKHLLEDESFLQFIHNVTNLLHSTLIVGNKILICGNGGSAADSQHFAAELVGRFMGERKALPVIALTTDTSILTAIGNDYGFDKIFERQVEALCSKHDVLLAISTSGDSLNVVKALGKAKNIGATTIALLGNRGGGCVNMADYYYIVPSSDSARIQEVHLLIEHLICELVEMRYISYE